MFIKLWLDVKHSTINHYFAFVVNLKLMFFKCHNFINTFTLPANFDTLLMYNITDTDLEFRQLLEPKVKEFEGQFENNMSTQEATLEMIYKAVKHSDFND